MATPTTPLPNEPAQTPRPTVPTRASTGGVSVTLNPQSLIFNPDDAFIVVTGVTGAGKSSFISKCCEGLNDIVGHSLWSHTQKCTLYTFTHNNKQIHLVDTPGFDDSKRSGTEVLKEIAEWLLYAFKQNVKLSGMIYLQSLSNSRMTGSQMVNLNMFKKVTGIHNMDRVVFVTTHWDKTPDSDAKAREIELMSQDKFWGEMIGAGSKTARFMNNKTSALAIVDKVSSNAHFMPSLQKEMAVDDKQLDETDAGRVLNAEINEAKEKSRREMKEMETQLNEALNEKDVLYAQQLMDIQTKLHNEMERLARNQKDMQVRSDELIKSKEEEIKKAREEMAELRDQAAERDKKHSDDVARMREENRKGEATMKAEFEKAKLKMEFDMQSFRDGVIDGAAQLVNEIDNIYAGFAAEQQIKTQAAIDQVRGNANAQAAAPPPYQAVPPGQWAGNTPPPPAPVMQQQMPMPMQQQQQQQQGPSLENLVATSAIGGAMAVGGSLASMAAVASVCNIM
ncbi:hypothetical protein UCRPC4_g05435 [Phaeomoniella chlamydospora]|uniref:AIG1-type G domain-containing protein n=1 Tax=Phaeomoniella chlamydospora TaxID=158046 RepID=A0A0G2E426_PHACM|nr:hypothetical protein UCRPC4_g05435 [Phaeomoniella chlamydospora]